MRIFLAVALLGAVPQSAERSFYEKMIAIGAYKVVDGVAAMQAFRSEPGAMDAVAWIEGDWDQTNVMIATRSFKGNSRPSGSQCYEIDRPRMTINVSALAASARRNPLVSYDPYTRRWVKSLPPPYSHGVLTAPRWSGSRLDLVGPVTLAGVSFTMRQTILRTGTDAFEIQNSEQLRDGSWRLIDKHVFKRRVVASAPRQ